jgi:mannose-6-phosphate isomerase-like protein (cupin superfamily)
VVRSTDRHSLDFDDVLSLDRLDEWLSMSARTPAVRMVVEGEPIDAARFCSSVRLGGRVLHDVVDPEKVARLLADGATVVAQSLHRAIPSVARFVTDLQRELTHPVQANAYLTPPSAGGLAAHADRHDVIVLQIDGEKSWWVDGLGEVRLHRGDAMYVPLGVRHRAATADTMSLHLTIGVIRVTRRDVVERVLGAGLDDPLPIGYRSASGFEELADAIADTLDDALVAIGAADVVETAESEQRRRLAPAPMPGRLRSVVGADRITDASVIRWIDPDPLARVVDGVDGGGQHWDGRPDANDWAPSTDRVEVRVGGRTLGFPIAALGALRRLGSGAPITVGELEGVDAPSRLVLARRLVREGACVVDRFGADGVG